MSRTPGAASRSLGAAAAARKPRSPIGWCQRRPAAAPRLLQDPRGSGSCHGRRVTAGVTRRLRGLVAVRRPSVPRPAALRRGGGPLRARSRELTARGALPWATGLGDCEAEACFTPPPVLPSAGPPAAAPGTYLAGRTQWPRSHSRSAPREVAAPPLPRPGAAGACAEEERGEAGASLGAGRTWRPVPSPALRAPRPGRLRGATAVAALPQVGGRGVRGLRTGGPGQAETSRRKVCARAPIRALGVREEPAAERRDVKYACSANAALGAGGPDLLGIRSRLPLRMRARGWRRRDSAAQRARRAESQSAGGPAEGQPMGERGRRERGQWRAAVV